MAEHAGPLRVPRPQRGPERQFSGGFVSWWRLNAIEEASVPRSEIILVLARWVLICVGMALTLNAPEQLVDLQITIAGLLALAVVNFWLHTNLLTKQQSSPTVLYWTSAADVVVVTAVVAISGGYTSFAYVFYLPAILAFSLVFPVRISTYLTAATSASYVLTLLAVSDDALEADPEGFAATLFTRLIIFAGVMVVATMFRWVEYRRMQELDAGAPRETAANLGASPEQHSN